MKVKTPGQILIEANRLARAWDDEARKRGLEGWDLGTVMATAAGLLLGRSALTPTNTLEIFKKSFTEGLRERGRN